METKISITKKSGVSNIRISITPKAYTRYQTTLGVSLSDKEFADLQQRRNSGKGKLTPKAQRAFEMLAEIYTKIERAEIEEKVNGTFVDVRYIVDCVKGVEVEGERDLAVNAFERYIADMGKRKGWSNGTIESRICTMREIERWNAAISTKDLATIDGFSGFELHLIDKGLSGGTVKRHFESVISFCGWAFDKGLCGDEYKRFKLSVSMAINKPIYLTLSELALIEGYEPKSQAERVAVDMFLFECYTSLRVSDVHKLRWADVTECNGSYLVSVAMQKTKVIKQTPIIEKAAKIIQRYKGYNIIGGYVFPQFALWTIRRNLKEIAHKVGINEKIKRQVAKAGKVEIKEFEKWELISTHTGRKTFVVNMLSMGVSPDVVMEFTGHRDIKSLNPYRGITSSAVADAVEALNKVINRD